MHHAIFPSQTAAGVTFSARTIQLACPPPDWTLTAYLRGPMAIQISARMDGRGFVFTVPASVTATWLPGLYWYAIRASQGADVMELERGDITVTPDLAQAGENYDGRSHARKVLDAIEAVLEQRSTVDQDRYRINNRELWRTPVADLLALRDRYRAEVRRADMARRGALFNTTVKIGFR